MQDIYTAPYVAAYERMHLDVADQKLYFGRPYQSGGADLCRMNLDGSGLEVILFDPGGVHYLAVAHNINQNPIAVAGPGQTVNATGQFTDVELNGSNSYDPDDDLLSFEWILPQGSTASIDDINSAITTGHFPVGPTLVTLLVTDGRGGKATVDLLITVQASDTKPPVVICTTDKGTLWPPDHHIEQVTVYVQPHDDVTSDSQLKVTASVSSSELDDGTGDGRFTGDVNGKDGYT